MFSGGTERISGMKWVKDIQLFTYIRKYRKINHKIKNSSKTHIPDIACFNCKSNVTPTEIGSNINYLLNKLLFIQQLEL